MSRVTYHRWMGAATATTMTLTLTGRRRCPYFTLTAPRCTRSAPALHPHCTLTTPLLHPLLRSLLHPLLHPSPHHPPPLLGAYPHTPRRADRRRRARRGVLTSAARLDLGAARATVASRSGCTASGASGSWGPEYAFCTYLSFGEYGTNLESSREEPGRGTRARDAGSTGGPPVPGARSAEAGKRKVPCHSRHQCPPEGLGLPHVANGHTLMPQSQSVSGLTLGAQLVRLLAQPAGLDYLLESSHTHYEATRYQWLSAHHEHVARLSALPH